MNGERRGRQKYFIGPVSLHAMITSEMMISSAVEIRGKNSFNRSGSLLPLRPLSCFKQGLLVPPGSFFRSKPSPLFYHVVRQPDASFHEEYSVFEYRRPGALSMITIIILNAPAVDILVHQGPGNTKVKLL